MSAVVIRITNKSASALGLLAEATDAVEAIRSVARQLLRQGREPSLPVHIVNHRTGYIVSRVSSLAAAVNLEFVPRLELPPKRTAFAVPAMPGSHNADGRRARGQRGGVKHRERALKAAA